MRGERAGDGAFARGGGAVDGDDHGCGFAAARGTPSTRPPDRDRRPDAFEHEGGEVEVHRAARSAAAIAPTRLARLNQSLFSVFAHVGVGEGGDEQRAAEQGRSMSATRSMAHVMRGRPVEQRLELREAGGDRARCRRPRRRRGWRGRRRPCSWRCGGRGGWRSGRRRRSGSPPVPSMTRPSSRLLDPRAGAGERGGHRGEAVAFLDPQLVEAAGDGAPFGQRGGDEQHREFVDHARGEARGRPRCRSAASGARAGRRPARRRLRARSSSSMLPPIWRSTSNRPARVGLRPTFSITRSLPGTISAATAKNAAEEGSPGTSMVCGLQLGLAAQADHALAVLFLDPQLGAEALEHALGVVARRHRLDHRGDRRRC